MLSLPKRDKLRMRVVLQTSALAAPTLPSATFTPGPIVEDKEIFFM
jgi:hypothetical protein